MIKIAIVEDEEASANLLISYIQEFQKETGEEVQVKHYTNGLQFLGEYSPAFDVVFMDIEMPELNGLDTAKKLRKIDEKICLIFVTNMSHFAIKGYEVDAMDFIVKPVSYYQFSLKLKKAINISKKYKESSFFVRVNEEIKRIYTRDLYFVEVQNHWLIYHTNKFDLKVRGSLKKEEEGLFNFGIVRCNNCYLVNLQYVSNVQDNIVTVDKYKLQISHARKKEFLNALTNYLGGNR